jgi:hypothetical protein
MADRVIEEKDLSIEEYLAVFDPASVDYALIKERSQRLSKITVKKVADASGRLFEDTTFTEKTGIHYTVRSVVEG